MTRSCSCVCVLQGLLARLPSEHWPDHFGLVGLVRSMARHQSISFSRCACLKLTRNELHRTVRVWQHGECAQVLEGPKDSSAWDVLPLPNGDIVVGSFGAC